MCHLVVVVVVHVREGFFSCFTVVIVTFRISYLLVYFNIFSNWKGSMIKEENKKYYEWRDEKLHLFGVHFFYMCKPWKSYGITYQEDQTDPKNEWSHEKINHRGL